MRAGPPPTSTRSRSPCTSAGPARTPCAGPPPPRPRARWASPCRPWPTTGPTCPTACARRSTHASSPTPTSAPALELLRHTLDAAAGDLDCDYAVPPPAGAEGERKPGLAPRPAALRAGLALGLAAACVVLAGPIGAARRRPARGSPRISRPALATSRGARRAARRGNRPRRRVGRAAPTRPLVAALERTTLARLALGALGWCWLLTACAALGIAPPAGLLEPPPANWDACAAAATFDALLLPLLEARVADRAWRAFAIGAAALGRILESRPSGDGRVRLPWCGPPASPRPWRLVGDGGMQWAPARDRGLRARRPRRGAAAPLARPAVPRVPRRAARAPASPAATAP